MYNHRRIRVVDSAAIARLVREAIDPQFETQSEAAAALGIQRTHYNRFLNGKAPRSITPRVWKALARWISSKKHVELLARATLLPEAQELLQRYSVWLGEQVSSVGYGSWLASVAARKAGVDDQVGAKAAQEDLVGRQWNKRQSRRNKVYGEILAHCERDQTCKQHVDAFERWRLGRGHSSARFYVAVYRAIEPLVESAEANGMERTWKDLRDAGDLPKYLKAGLDRERILLKRLPDLQQGQKAAAQ